MVSRWRGRRFSTHRFQDVAGRVHRYALFLPFENSAKLEPKKPVIVFLNGGGGNGDDGVAQISDNFGRPVWEMRGRFPFIGIAPQVPMFRFEIQGLRLLLPRPREGALRPPQQAVSMLNPPVAAQKTILQIFREFPLRLLLLPSVLASFVMNRVSKSS